YDGWSNGIILEEFFHAYYDLLQRRPPVLPAKTEFKDYIRWIQERNDDRQNIFWRNYLSGFDTPAKLSVKRRVIAEITEVNRLHISLNKNFRSKLERFVRGNKITLATLIYGAYGILLQKYNNSNDVIFGTTVSGRRVKIKGIENLVGLCINTVPLRVRTGFSDKIQHVLKQVNETLQVREEYETTPLVNLKEYSLLADREELFDSIVVIENYPLNTAQIMGNGPLSIDSYSMFEMTNYDLTVAVALSDTIEIDFIYNSDSLEQDVIDGISRHFYAILKDISENPGNTLCEIDILSSEEKQQLLFGFNAREADYPTKKTIPQLVGEQAEKTPGNIALSGLHSDIGKTALHRDVFLSYGEMEWESDRLARYLLNKGVQPDELIGILVNRFVDMIIGILGILKAGCGYVPLNPKAPVERSAYMLTECCVNLLLTVRSLEKDADALRSPGVETVYIDETGRKQQAKGNIVEAQYPVPSGQGGSGSTAYVIFTSGSTGKPKGVPIRHNNFSPLMHWGYKTMGIGSRDRVLQNLSYYFDWSVWEIFITLTSGACLIMVSDDVIINPEAQLLFMQKQAITVLHITPTHFQALVNVDTGKSRKALTHLKCLALGAEKLNYDLMKRTFDLVSRDCRVFNMYGPTEATIMSAVLEIERRKQGFYKSLSSIPIGYPIANLELLILDRNLRLMPLYVPGELFIGGDGVASGYLNNPELTAEKFISFAYQKDVGAGLAPARDSSGFDGQPQGLPLQLPTDELSTYELIYKTGDLACRLADGSVEFLGRIDQQVKIRGFRIEPGEIENQLLEHEAVKEAVVLPRVDKGGELYLCAYLVGADPGSRPPLNAAGLREYLSQTLPDYMIPSYFVTIGQLPLTANGKIDTRSLPEPQIGETGRQYAAPRNEIDAKLVDIWRRVLTLSDELIGIDDNFFASGGHSLKASALMARVHKEFDVEIPLGKIFKSPTIRGLAELIGQKERSLYRGLKAAKKRDDYPLSPAQKRIYILLQMDHESVIYNMSGVMRAVGEIHREKLERSFNKLIERHESLRTSFFVKDGEPRQRIHDSEDIEFKIEYFSDLGARRAVPEGPHHSSFINHRLVNRFARPFDLSQAPLLRVGLIQEDETAYIIMVDMHHIISDGTSIGVFIRDFMSVYRGDELPPLRIQYKDFAEWQNSGKDAESMKKQEAYWLAEFSGEIPVLDLPGDFLRPIVQSFAGKQIEFTLSGEDTAALKILALEQNATPYMVLLAIFNILLSRLSGQEDIVIGSPIVGRKHIDLTPIMGMFINTLAMRNYPCGGKGFTEFLEEVKERATAAFENQDYQFEDLVEKVAVKRDAGRNPLFDVVFAMQNIDIPGVDIPGLKLTPLNYHSGVAKFDLTFNCEDKPGRSAQYEGYEEQVEQETEEVLLITVEYSVSLFREETVRRYIAYFKNIVKEVIRDCGITLGEIEIINEQERRQLLFDFNPQAGGYPIDKTIVQLFADQVAKTPNQKAVVFAGEELSYEELDNRSSDLAFFLMERGIAGEGQAALKVERSLEMITGILGILKTGCGYVPLNPRAPEERNSFILNDCDIKIMLTSRSLFEDIEGIENPRVETIFIDEIANRVGARRAVPEPTPPFGHPSGEGISYVIYTSGSTGFPKGVPITNANLCQLLHWGYRELAIDSGNRTIQNLSYYFDWSVWEIFITLTTGAALYMAAEEVLINPAACIEFISDNKITILHVTPTQYSYLVGLGKKLETLQYLFIGAEKLTYDLLRQSINSVLPGCRVFNMYGPTEATIISAVLEIDRGKYRDFKVLSSVPIGKGVGNTALLVLDKYFKLCPVNVTGELAIAGDGVAAGYLNNPELTNEKFVDFASQHTDS
ncbi:MAG: amino acid adenylation domain-containing protein, partial [Candidatus Aminicenantes bacterium]|nr:amino acid adenylation domain-containing protein [Candidatus Aminicenantes bacterium]